MLWKDVSKNWVAYTPRILQQWPNLDEAEVLAIDGDQNKFLDYLSKSKGHDDVAAQMELADWLIGGEPLDVTMDAHNDNAQISDSARNVPAGEDPSDDDRRFGDDATAERPMGRTA